MVPGDSKRREQTPASDPGVLERNAKAAGRGIEHEESLRN